MRDRPNIVVCICDQLRAFETGCYGNEVIRTPNVDRLAGEGVRFETAVSNFPVCMAARSVLLSGQYNRLATGGIGNVSYAGRKGSFSMPEYPYAGRPHLRGRTLAEELQVLGYFTGAIGKWHIHSWPHEIGFDYYLIPRVHHCHSAQPFTANGGPEFVPEGYSVDYEAERVEQFIGERAGKERPFFLYYSISPPHCPVADAPEEYLRMYDPAKVPIRPNVDLDRPLKDQEYWFKVYRWDYRYYDLHLPFTEQLPEGYTLRHLIAEYYGVATWMDAALGRMLGALDENGLAEDTIVVFTADHGDNLGSHRLVQKGGPTEESVRIPYILRGPAFGERGRVVEGQVGSLVDLMPSLLELVGSTVPGHVHGRSLAPVVRGEREAIDEEYAFIETGGGVGMRTPSHMYYLPFAGEERKLKEDPSYYFDMAVDPYQLDNLAGRGEREETARELDARLRGWHERVPWMETAE